MIEAGEKAPDFTLPDQDENEVTLSELRGEPVVLYFYPRADTPGCTTQACGVRDHRLDYERAGARVIGVSPDPVSALKKFADKHSLDFTLLADAGHSVCELYGVWREKNMYGSMRGRAAAEGEARPVSRRGAQRATFVIDPAGTIAKVFPKVSPKTHDELMLKALVELEPAS